jgi:hypothetical protein
MNPSTPQYLVLQVKDNRLSWKKGAQSLVKLYMRRLVLKKGQLAGSRCALRREPSHASQAFELVKLFKPMSSKYYTLFLKKILSHAYHESMIWNVHPNDYVIL